MPPVPVHFGTERDVPGALGLGDPPDLGEVLLG